MHATPSSAPSSPPAYADGRGKMHATPSSAPSSPPTYADCTKAFTSNCCHTSTLSADSVQYIYRYANEMCSAAVGLYTLCGALNERVLRQLVEVISSAMKLGLQVRVTYTEDTVSAVVRHNQHHRHAHLILADAYPTRRRRRVRRALRKHVSCVMRTVSTWESCELHTPPSGDLFALVFASEVTSFTKVCLYTLRVLFTTGDVGNAPVQSFRTAQLLVVSEDTLNGLRSLAQREGGRVCFPDVRRLCVTGDDGTIATKALGWLVPLAPNLERVLCCCVSPSNTDRDVGDHCKRLGRSPSRDLRRADGYAAAFAGQRT